ncbi:unnamed protein product [Cuscuta epithymum]|uniref:Uncharacterized protein n=1 Tax=Cuscuta epithymum TaxID=186058 RepID=A0AAV0CPE3_9ASTE|nr:unnamed protein product [Cuscuta epithymum]
MRPKKIIYMMILDIIIMVAVGACK